MTHNQQPTIRDGQGREIISTPFITQNDLSALAAHFVVKEDDVFIVTYPRSGTTWTEQIVHLLLNQGRQGEQLLTDAVPWWEAFPHRVNDLAAALAGMTTPRRFTSHLPYSFLASPVESGGRYVYVARNPKDVAVSYYYHDVSKGNYTGTWAEHFTLFLNGQLAFGSYFDHVLSWWLASRQRDNILFLKYEDMKRDLATVTKRIASFLAVEAHEELVSLVLERSTFQAMSTGEKTDFSWIPQQEGVPTHYRKGVIGDWRNHFSTEQNQFFDALFLKKMSGVGLKFDFGEGLYLP